MSSFGKDVASFARRFGMTTGGSAGVVAAGSVSSGITGAFGGSSALAIAAGANPVGVGVILVAGGAYGGWWIAKRLTDSLDSD
ncbi:MAG: hypothetical protein AAFY46_13745 [Planctomycetota bacterium]